MAARGERKAEIASAALRLAGREGLASFTVAALAAEVGLTVGALFRHYPSREAILEAAASRLELRVARALAADEPAPFARLEAFVRAATVWVDGEPPFARLLFSEQTFLAVPGGAAARLAAVVERTRAHVVAALREAAVRGAIRSDLPAEALAPLLLGATYALSLSASPASPLVLAPRPEGVRRAMMALLAAPARAKPEAPGLRKAPRGAPLPAAAGPSKGRAKAP